MSEHHLHYSMLIEWSEEDQAYLVTLPEWADRVVMPATHGSTYAEAVHIRSCKPAMAHVTLCRSFIPHMDGHAASRWRHAHLSHWAGFREDVVSDLAVVFSCRATLGIFRRNLL